MNSLSVNTYAHAGSSSELILSYSGESEPPSYAQIPQNPHIQPGKYVLRDITTHSAAMSTTVITPKDGSSLPIFHIVSKKLPMVPTNIIFIRKGPPELNGKVLATFELEGRDMIMIDSESQVLSSAFTFAQADFGVPRSFRMNFGNVHCSSLLRIKAILKKIPVQRPRWIRDSADMKKTKERPNLSCHPRSARQLITWARFSWADPMLAFWEPETHLEEHELEIFPEGVHVMDDCIVSLFVLLLARVDLLAKLGRGAK
ncbi:hypothetical protein DL96DRAFT_1631474 [Flagelloscypha sp. PMI_526]|nr:hypothetical protein DL96DRAFT_1631474 [Flagelloscypha sp. PMI_526]